MLARTSLFVLPSPFKLSLLAASLLVLNTAAGSELVEFGSSTGPYLVPQFLSADGSIAVGGLANNNGNIQVGRWSAGSVSTLPSLGGATTYARALSANGAAIVGTSQTSGGQMHAFRWVNGAMTDLGTQGGTASEATAVSASGAVVVGYSTASPSSYTTAFRWENNAMQNLGTLGGVSSAARAVSANGAVVAGESNIANSDVHAFRWANNVMADLGTLGGNYSRAVGLSGDGAVVIGESLLIDNLFTHAFRWSGGTMQDLGTLGGHYSVAQFVSADGSVVAGRSILANNVDTRVFRWAGTGMVDLGSLGGSSTQASDMSADGSILVGRSQDATAQYRAYRWTSSLGMQTVQAWLSDNGVSVQGSDPVTAAAVSDDGDVIAGQLSNGHGYLARVIAAAPPGAPGSGLIDINDYLNGMAQVRVQTSTLLMNLNDVTLNGLHGNPMRSLLGAGQQNVWTSGDIGRSDHDDYDGNMAVGEVGYGIGLLDGLQVNLAVGRTRNTQNGSLDSQTKVHSYYFLPELIARIPETPLYVTLSGLYNTGDSDIERGYLNAGNPSLSKGSTDVKSWGARLRVDWLNAFTLGASRFTPYASHTYLRSKIDGYTESGGGFPVAWDSTQDRTNTSRLGVDVTHAVNSSVTLLGRIEGAHRYEQQGEATQAQILGAGGSSFDVPGAQYKRNWMRVGTGVEINAGPGIASVTLNATSEGENPDYWLSAGYQLRF